MAYLTLHPVIEIVVFDDVHAVIASQRGNELAKQLGYSTADRTRLGTAILEAARNIVKYAGSGTIALTSLCDNNRIGIQVVAQDNGPGIEDVDLALVDGYSTGQSLGLGLSGVKRLMDSFELFSRLGEGTTLTFIGWKK